MTKPSEYLASLVEEKITAQIYRGIYTSFPSKNLFSDLEFREGDREHEIAIYLADRDAAIDQERPQHERGFQYGQIKAFLRSYVSEAIPREEVLEPFRRSAPGRFSDGTFPVFYGALDEATAIAECAYHVLRTASRQKATAPDVFVGLSSDKRIVVLEAISERAMDFRRAVTPELTSDDYSFCQAIGKLMKEAGIDFALAPSARNEGGVCVPVFYDGSLRARNVKTIRYYRFEVDKDLRLSILKSSLEEIRYELPESWNFVPKF